MNRFFSMDSPIMAFLSKLADLMILNILFLVTCIPVITIGAAWTSLSYMAMKVVRNEESYIVRGYFKAFKQNFRQSTIIWIIVLCLSILLILDMRIMGIMGNGEILYNIVLVGIYIVTLLLLFILQYLFPLVAKFYNSIKNTFLNALLMSISHLPQTILMAVIFVVPALVTFLNEYTLAYGLLVWILIGFSLIALINSWFLVRIFDKYIPEETDAAGASEAAGNEPLTEVTSTEEP